MIENNKPANEKIVKHIDRCLSCYSCMTTCPSGVNYMHLIDHGRSHIEKTYKRPFVDRMVRNFLSIVLPNSNNFKFITIFAFLVKPLRFFFPKKIKNMIDLIPSKFPKKTLADIEIYKPTKKRKPVARVALLTGCVQKIISPQINEALSLIHI